MLDRIDGIVGYREVLAISAVLTVDNRDARVITVDGLSASNQTAKADIWACVGGL